MGSTIRRRFYAEPISCEWAWVYSETEQTKIYRAISSGTGNDTPGQTLSDWERMDHDYDRSVDEAGE
jgi:hypothetical protein